MNELAVEQIHKTSVTRLAAASGGKLELADAVRDCFRDLPTGEALTVAGHTLRWIEAFCAVWGGFDWPREETYAQRVMTLNGRLLDEPHFVITRPDWADSVFHRDGNWEGPLSGWYSVAAEQGYERACTENWEYDHDIKKPDALRACDLAELSEVVRALPIALGAWSSRKHAELENVIGDPGAEAELFQLPTATMHISR